jgi:hypothetical protein
VSRRLRSLPQLRQLGLQFGHRGANGSAVLGDHGLELGTQLGLLGGAERSVTCMPAFFSASSWLAAASRLTWR